MDGWRRHSERHLAGSDRRQGIRQVHTVGIARNWFGFRRNFGRLRKRLELRLCQYVVLAKSNDADSDGEQSAEGVRTALR